MQPVKRLTVFCDPRTLRAGVIPLRPRLTLVIASASALSPTVARAQLLQQYLPAGVPGYEADPVMAVVANGGPDYSSSGIRTGDFIVRPTIDETVGFDENPLGLPEQRSSATLESAAAVRLNSDWARDALGASFSVDDHRFPELPIANTTTYTAFAGGSLDMFHDDRLDLSAGYTSSALSPTNVLTEGLTAPVPYNIADFRAAYAWNLNRLSITPEIDYAHYGFGTAYGGGTVQNYSGLDKDQVAGGATADYTVFPGLNGVLSVQETSASFLHRQAVSTNPNYLDTLVLGGVRDEADALIHWAVLAGYENRSFSGSGQSALSEPAVEAALTYYPTGLTTLQATVTHRLSDAGYNIVQNVTYTEGALNIDHALRRNVILLGKLDVAHTDADAGTGAHTQLVGSAGATWLLTRNVHLSANYVFSHGSSDIGDFSEYGLPAASVSRLGNQSYTSNAIEFSVHLQL